MNLKNIVKSYLNSCVPRYTRIRYHNRNLKREGKAVASRPRHAGDSPSESHTRASSLGSYLRLGSDSETPATEPTRTTCNAGQNNRYVCDSVGKSPAWRGLDR